ncbi:MAG: 16S rRNA (adenine(1518)-N(6)/adenine(1519)-N(6))-dimethyltransferase RsmA [Culicoidibacterales bacterium]
MKRIATPSNTKEILAKHGFSMKKKFGQNFLIDQNVLSNIVERAEVGPTTGVIEIGPGIGALTEHLAHNAKKVVAFEIDTTLQPILADTLSHYDNVKIIWQDILEADLAGIYAEEFADCDHVSVVANLPYYITTPILTKLIESRLPFKNLAVMMQKEVAERLSAAPSTKEYGSLTIAMQLYADVSIILNVPKNVFIPQPNVDSAVVRLAMLDKPRVELADERVFFAMTRGAFAYRRKTIQNNFNTLFKDKEYVAQLLDTCEVSPKLRGEALDLATFAKLANQVVLDGKQNLLK